MAIKLITFDLDDTLWRVDGVIRRAEKEMRAWLEPHVPEYSSVDVDTLQKIRHAVATANPSIVHDLSKLREVILSETISHLGYPRERAAELAAGAFDVFIEWRHAVEFFDDALPTLDRLAPSHTLGALTNGNANFERVGLGQWFSFGYCSADVNASKPDPAMFIKALERAGVAPGEAVHIGDNPVDDIDGARAVGMRTIWVSREADESRADADATVRSLADIPSVIDRWT